MKLKSGFILTAALMLLFQGCAANGGRQFVDRAQRPVEYRQFFDQVDRVVAEFKIGDASTFRVDGFPYLRTNRFLAALGEQLSTETEHRTWVAALRQLDLDARAKEVRNMPDAALSALQSQIGDGLSREDITAMTAIYSNGLLLHDWRRPGFFGAVKAAIDIPDEYSIAMRTFGLYPLTSIPVTVATKNAYQKFGAWYETPMAELPVSGAVEVFRPPPSSRLPNDVTAAVFKPDNLNPLGLPRLTTDQLAALAAAHAPVIHQDVAADYDRFGRVEWRQDKVTVNTDMPTVYYYLTFAFIQKKPILQINYAFWFTERAGPNAPSIEKGPLDGMTIRVNLDFEGKSMMVDVMNTCGCYYLFIPRREAVEKVIPDRGGIGPFIPAWLPDEFPAQPLNFRINSGWHQVQQVFIQKRFEGAVAYKLMPYAILESLPHKDGRYESVFDDRGIMKDSSRIEPYIFFPMGVPKVGYMRQRGHHAIKLVGRAHFTDPNPFDEYFRFK